MKQINLSAAILVMSLLSTPALSKYNDGEVDKLPETEQKMKNVEMWRMPAVPEDIPTFQIIDTQPQTRAIAKDRAVYRLGYSINEMARAHRLHIDYLPGSDNLTYEELQSIKSLVLGGNEQDRVIVTGYSGNEDPTDGDAALARSRANKIRSVINHANPDIVVQTDSTIYWGGSSNDGRRAEIFLIPGLDH